jgi:hypothetical protein
MRTPRAMTSPQSSQVLSRSQGRAPTASGGAAGGSNISSMRLHRREDFLPFGHRGCGSQSAAQAAPAAVLGQVNLRATEVPPGPATLARAGPGGVGVPPATTCCHCQMHTAK